MSPRARSLVHPRPQLLLEELESRTLLSASGLDTLTAAPQVVDTQASVSLDPQKQPGSGSGSVTNKSVVGYTPSQISQAYGFNGITFNGPIQGNGAGQTIAIVDAYNDPNILKDANAFSSQFSLPQFNTAGGPTLTVVNQNGNTTSLPMTNASWSLEISLDVEWAHAMAPQANIVLVEANSNSLNNLLTAVNYASQHASVVSMSWGGSEFSSETAYDSYFTHPGVTYVASSGDQGAPTSWPAVSPNVVAVGGTSLTTDANGNYVSESGWSGSGGGISAYESKPTYQGSLTQYSKRTNPDVAYNANPNTGYAVYDTVAYYGQTGWFEVGGTSAAAPQWAALVAIANQGRQLANGGSPNPLSGASQTLPALYNMSSSDFHDITSGNNGYSAGTGYDLVTGRGSPVAGSVVNALVSYNGSASASSSASTGSSSTSGSGKAAHAAVLETLADPPSGSSSSFTTVALAGTPGPATTANGSAVLIEPAQTLAAAGLPFDPAAVSTLAFGTFQTPSAFNVNLAAPSAATLLPGWQIYAPGPQSISTQSPALGTSLRTPFLPESVDAAPLRGTASDDDLCEDGPLAPRQAIPVPATQDSGFELIPVLPAKEQLEQMLPCDECFLDEIGVVLMGEQALALTSGDAEGSFTFRVPDLALFGLLAGSLWLTPDDVEETRKRRSVAL